MMIRGGKPNNSEKSLFLCPSFRNEFHSQPSRFLPSTCNTVHTQSKTQASRSVSAGADAQFAARSATTQARK
jgi:hypothetical protein